MKTSIHGSIAVAALCAFLAACGGSDSPPAPTVLPASVAITSDARAEAGTAATFKTDLSTTTGLTFRWDFGDGSTGTGASTSHAYAKPGTYQVTLAVANDAEDLRSATSSIQVGAYANVTGLACSQADSAGWCWQHAIVTGHQVNDMFFVDATHAWAVGDGLTILKSTDGGDTWSQVALDATLPVVSLRSVRFYDSTHGMVLDDRGGALGTADGGATWTALSLGTFYGSAATFVDYRAGRIIVQSSYGNGSMSVDGGHTWTSVASYGLIQATSTDCWSFSAGSAERALGCATSLDVPLSSFMPNGSPIFAAGAFASDSQALIVGTGYTYSPYFSQASFAWSTTDGGATWTPFTPNGLPSYVYYGLTLHMIDPQAGVLYGASDLSAYVTADGDHNWTTVVSSPALTQVYNNYRATGLVGNGVLWQSAGNRLALSTDRGQTWHDAVVHAEDGVAQNWQSTSAVVTQYTDANDFLVTISHRFYITNDGGQTFRQVLGADSRDAGATYAAGAFSDIRNGKFLSSNGALLSTKDGGRTWTRLDYPTTANAPVALHFTSATEGWLVLDGKLDHSTDGGATWSTPLASSAMTSLQGMSWGDATHGWTWNGSWLFYTADGGATWTQATLPLSTGVTSATMTGPLTGVVASSYYGTSITQDGGATWQAVTTSISFGNLVHAGGQTVWSVSGSNLLRSKDGGRTWQVAGPSLYNSSVNSMTFADDLHGWLITNNGGVLRTIDGGESWTAQPVGQDLVLDAIVAVDTQTAWIITRDGQILSTATAGD